MRPPDLDSRPTDDGSLHPVSLALRQRLIPQRLRDLAQAWLTTADTLEVDRLAETWLIHQRLSLKDFTLLELLWRRYV